MCSISSERPSSVEGQLKRCIVYDGAPTLGERLKSRLHFVDEIPGLCQRGNSEDASLNAPDACAALWLLKTEGHVCAILLRPYYQRVCLESAVAPIINVARRTLLFLIAIIFRYSRLE